MKRLLIILTFSLAFLLTAFAEKRNTDYYVKIRTTEGDIIVRLYNETPLHRDNFIKLAKSKYYNKILFHRVIKQFVIQAGDPQSRNHEKGKLYGDGSPDYNIPAEIIPGMFHRKGVLAAARESDSSNPSRESSASQFYIVVGKLCNDKDLDAAETKLNLRNTANKITLVHKFTPEQRVIYQTVGGVPHLDTQYTIFGEVVKGMELVDKISLSETDTNDRPINDIWIISTKVFKKKSAN